MYIRKLHRDFVFTVTDKLSNNYAVCCKKFYVESLLQDLRSDFFSVVSSTDEKSAVQVVKPVALWLTSLFRAINIDLVREWRFILKYGVAW